MGEISTNSLIAKNLIYSSSVFLGPECFIVEDIKASLKERLELLISFAGRELNRGAHFMAKYVVSVTKPSVWFGRGPNWLLHVIFADSGSSFFL